jgi:hypothetical protein
LINEKHGQGTHSTKLSAEKSSEKYSKGPKIYLPQIVCPRPKVWDFDEKRLHWASVVRGHQDLVPLLRNELLFRGSVDFVNADVSGLGTFKHLGKTESCVRLMDLFNPSR